MLLLSTFELKDVVVVHVQGLGCHGLLPPGKSVELGIALNSVVGSVKELFTEFEAANEHQPRIPHISLANLSTLTFKPVTFLLNKFFALFSSTLVSKLDEVVAGTVSTISLSSEVDTTLQCIQSLGATNPSVVASSEHLAIEHVPNALKFRDLLSLSSVLLISLDILFALKFIKQILVLVSVILGHFEQVDMDFLVC